MSSSSRGAGVGSPAEEGVAPAPGLSPAGALGAAFFDTIQLLLNPFDARRWIQLGVICFFLGGGASSAAFHWSLGALPADVGFQEALLHMREYIAARPWLILLTIATGIALSVTLIYLRSLSRFVLVDTILKREVMVRRALPQVRPLAHSYFFWLLGALVVFGAALGLGVLASFPFSRAAATAGSRSIAYSMILASLLLAEVFVGLLAAALIIFTDDLAVPVMYAERLPLLAAWRKVGGTMRAEARDFTLYVLLRFLVSVVLGVAVLVLLFPTLVALLSGAVIVGALIMMGLQLMGVAWAWTPLAVLLAALALLLLMGLLLLLLSVAGMPGQVFLQSFGICFIAPRAPALSTLWRAHPLASREE